VIVAVLQQSDSALILPSSVFDVGELLGKFKEGVPGGSFFAPVLNIKIPLILFYAAAPICLLALHATIVLSPRLLNESVRPLRWASLWVPPFALAIIRWRFAPYVSARPETETLLLGSAILWLQVAALAADSAVVVFGLLKLSFEKAGLPLFRPNVILLPRAFRHAGLVWLVILLFSTIIGIYSEIDNKRLTDSDISHVSIALFSLLFATSLIYAWFNEARFFGLSFGRTRLLRATEQGDMNMFTRFILSGAFVILAALPSFARILDLSGEELVGRAPNEIMIAALIPAAQEVEGRVNWERRAESLTEARVAAWVVDGRGIDLSHWRFPRGRFDRSTMAHIKLVGATLSAASFDFANLIGADLTEARAERASFRWASMERAVLKGVRIDRADFSGADLRGATLVAANTPIPGGAPIDVPKPPDCKGPRTDFSQANLSGADLRHANLTCANLNGVRIDQTTKLEGAIINGADFTGSHLMGAHFEKSEGANGADFTGADLRCAKLPYSMVNAKLDHANVLGAKLDLPPNSEEKSLVNATLTNATQEPPAKDSADEAKLTEACKALDVSQ
jgi:uncharacterized protein YjbI with pentapeptide repeats